MYRVWMLFLLVVPLVPLAASPTAANPIRETVTINVGADVSPEDVTIAREGIRYAQDFFVKTFGAMVPTPLTVNLVYDPHPQGEHVSFEQHGVITEDTWDLRGYSYLQRLGYMVHGYTHIWQLSLDHKGPTPYESERGPAWLIEGSAEYLQFQSLVATGMTSQAVVDDYLVRLADGLHAPSPPTLPPLQDFANEQDLFQPGVGCCSYALGALAVAQLTASVGITSLRRYFAGMGNGEDWTTAFTQAFGQSPDAFDASFEAQRATLLTSTGQSIDELDVTPQYNDVPAEITVTSVTNPVIRGDQALLIGTTAPGAHCTLDFVSAKGNPLLTESTYADSVGTVFWLFSVRQKLALGTATATVSCGGTVVRVPVQLA